MNVLATLTEASAALHDGEEPSMIAARWGTADDPTSRMIIVTPSDPGWSGVRVLVDASGRADEVVFELPDGAEIPVSQLVSAYGEPKDAEDAVDGPRVFWFEPPDNGGCLISATLRRRSAAVPTTRRLSVVAPRRPRA